MGTVYEHHEQLFMWNLCEKLDKKNKDNKRTWKLTNRPEREHIMRQIETTSRLTDDG